MSILQNRSGDPESKVYMNGANGEGELKKTASTKSQLCRFLIAGGMATALQYFTLWLCVHGFETSAALGSGLGYFLGSVLNYLLNYFFTFDTNEKHTHVAWRFYVMVLVGWAINTGCVALLADSLQWNKWVAQILATALSMVSNFSLSKSWVFKKK
ncbi:GtrA family protein [Pseudomonas nitroreducens]|uniref:GtrA family protein n=1 Tax=Pseudomonas nitroreducens TaxID=46680 RepID=UPI002FDF9CD7